MPPRAARPLVLALLATAALGPPPAAAADATFVAELDREAVAPGEPFVYQVTLTVANESVDDYRPPDFKGLQVVSAPQFPSRSTSMQIGGGQTVVQNGYSWRYELAVPAGHKGPITIGAARARVAGREMRSNPVQVRLGSGAGTGAPPPAAPAPRSRGGFPLDPFADLLRGAEPPSATPAGASFVRAVADRSRAYLGEQVTVSWYLYVTQRPDKFQPVTEPRTDGFWTEEIPSTAPKGRLLFTQENMGGRAYQVALLFKKALFPLRAGKLTITPLEAEVAQVDFFGTALRAQRLKTEPLTVEAVALPREGQPAGFDPANVGNYVLAARADRTTVAVGEAVSITVEIRGTGNVRNVQPPALPRLPGWKSYEPKVNVNVDLGDAISGAKTVEVLFLPERPGTTTFPALELPMFDPRTGRYAVARSEPLRLEVTGETAPAARGPAGAAAPSSGAGVENVIAPEVRPIRARTRLSREVGVTFLRSPAFTGILIAPPAAFGLTLLFGSLRERLSEESRARRRRTRALVRKRLAAAEGHRHGGRTAAFYIEIDRVLREVLAARLGRPVSGLRFDELGELLRARGLPPEEAARVVAELEACDQARFAPGGQADGTAAMGAALERAGELIVAIEKAPLREEARA